jgi:uncharacterized tellurite resistance protein B-like protein
MFKTIRTLLGDRGTGQGPGPDPAERSRIAAAVLLLEAAHSDQECAPEEMDHVIATLRAQFSLSRECTDELLELAHRERTAALDLWQFTNRINEHFSREEKRAILEGVWRVIHADGKLDGHEDYFSHKLAPLLRLTHDELIEAKIRARTPR